MILYHISHQYLGENPTFSPKIPDHPMPGENETIPRICTAPTISGCYLAILSDFYLLAKEGQDIPEYFVYATETDKAVFAGENVPDSNITGEHWIKEPTQFHLIGKAPRIKITMKRYAQKPFLNQLRKTVDETITF
jgi:hypothetical protein